MALGDDVIIKMFELCTDVPMDEIKKMEKEMKSGANPRDYKMKLAFTIVGQYNDQAAAREAEKHFKGLFQEKEAPKEMKVFKTSKEKINIIDVLVEAGLCASNGDAKRNIEQGGVKADGHILEGWDVDIMPTKEGVVIQKGKRHFVRVIKK